MSTLVLGMGNPDRGDDAVGLVVAEQLAKRCPDVDVRAWTGPDIDLLDVWAGRERVLLVDAARSDDQPGTCRRHLLVGSERDRWSRAGRLARARAGGRAGARPSARSPARRARGDHHRGRRGVGRGRAVPTGGARGRPTGRRARGRARDVRPDGEVSTMCLGDLGVVVAPDHGQPADPDRVLVRTDRGLAVASRLLVPHVRPGDRVVVHSGHVLSVLDPAAAAEADRLRATPSSPREPTEPTEPTGPDARTTTDRSPS